ncbi:alpha/beta hydrolase [Tamlana sedimentorum]|uniref:Alpha/beta hydrolase n=1 Tax=Neotamlana sedimentorum TaxID=1435349 RepID=A0A0D7WC91_9FLAO|nr:alpha/beta fold hydrolase [Tamlana sedimentorum]KJD36303.1 alpha/beta hydrolase [Tamlana sedimentorum]
MPVIESTYKPAFYFKNRFVSTVYSGLVRRVKLNQERERITLKDNDFLDLDWSYSTEKTNKIIILLHGLEGNSKRPYITGTAKLFNLNGVDALAVNFRGCSEEDNLSYHTYHSGFTTDLQEVINHVLSKNKYDEIYIKGISLGANLLLKYLGETQNVPKEIKKAIAVSVPCDLYGSCKEISKLKNKPYHDRFLKSLLVALSKKQEKFPDKLTIEAVKSIKNLQDFDNVYTSKAHGFIDAVDYYTKCSALQFLPNIKVPTLIINALNDSFLSPECYPVKEAKQNQELYLEMPNHGGHVGFIDKKNVYYNERRALEFIKTMLNT